MIDPGYSAAELVDGVLSITGESERPEALALVNAGYRRFLGGFDYRDNTTHQWRFLQRIGTLTIGTPSSFDVSVSGTAITATEGCFDQSMVGQIITIETAAPDGVMITSVIDENNAVIADELSPLSDRSSSVLTGAYDLPAGFSGLLEAVYAYSGRRKHSPQLTDELEILEMYQNSNTSGIPTKYCIMPACFSSTVGQRWRIMFAPLPVEAMTVHYRYRYTPDLLIDNDSVYPVGGSDAAQAIMACCKAAAELDSGRETSVFERRAQTAMAEAIDLDNKRYPDSGVLSFT